ncbi:MAG: hypothetical protein M3Y91_06980 [Actinomycetota bacterium]|nr:hypothetical protein [Actinomycetota bacterium]
MGFTHFSHIAGIEDYRELFAGEPVDVEWGNDMAQDGCHWSVAKVWAVDRT